MFTWNRGYFHFTTLLLQLIFFMCRFFSHDTLSIANLTFKCIHSNRLCNGLHFVVLFNMSVLPLFNCIYCLGMPFVIKPILVLFWEREKNWTKNYSIENDLFCSQQGEDDRMDHREHRNNWRVSHFFLSHFYSPDLFHVKPITWLPDTPIIKCK